MTQIQSPRSVSAGATGTKHALEFDDDAPLPMYYGAQGNTQLHFSSMHICGGQLAVPNPRHHLTYEQLVGLVTRGLLVVALPAGKTPTTGETRRLPLYRLVGPGARNETGGGRREKCCRPRAGRRRTQSVACLSQQLQRGGYDRKQRDQRRAYFVRTSEECS